MVSIHDLIVNNLIFRVQGTKEQPHPELEQTADPRLAIWIKDYDIRTDDLNRILDHIRDAIALAAVIRQGDKSLFIELNTDQGIELPPGLLKKLAEVDCTIEIHS